MNESYPHLADETIEAKASELLTQYSEWAKEAVSVPVPAEVIAEQFLGYELDITNEGIFSDPDYMGGVLFNEHIIKINSALENHEGRYNFTIAHEIGHHVLHREHYIRQNENQIMCRGTGEKPMVEQQADRFAAALLMPEKNVREAFSLATADGSLPFAKPTTQALRALAAGVVAKGQFTNVSNTAMVNRLIDLRIVSGARYQTGTPQDFYRRNGSAPGLNRQTFSCMMRWLLHPLKTFKQIRNRKND